MLCSGWCRVKYLCLCCVQVERKVREAVGEEKLDAVICVAGGWAGGNVASPGKDVHTSHISSSSSYH